MCGKAVPFRLAIFIKMVQQRGLSLAAARKIREAIVGKPKAFRTSGGKAAKSVNLQKETTFIAFGT